MTRTFGILLHHLQLVNCVHCIVLHYKEYFQVFPEILPEMQPKLPEKRRQPKGHEKVPGTCLKLKARNNLFSGRDIAKSKRGGESAGNIRQYVSPFYSLTISYFYDHKSPLYIFGCYIIIWTRFVHNNSKHGRRAKRLDPTEGKYYNCKYWNNIIEWKNYVMYQLKQLLYYEKSKVSITLVHDNILVVKIFFEKLLSDHN